jgi:hypothetical protein
MASQAASRACAVHRRPHLQTRARRKTAEGPALALLNVIRRKGIEAIL